MDRPVLDVQAKVVLARLTGELQWPHNTDVLHFVANICMVNREYVKGWQAI